MAAAKPTTGLEYLLDPESYSTGPLCVVSGTEAFLKHEVISTLRHQLVGDDDGSLAWNVFSGPIAEWLDISDSISSLSLFGSGKSIAFVEEADKFVTRTRDQLEDHANSGASGVVVLDLSTLPSNTRLAKAVAAHGLRIHCTAPDRGRELTQYRREASRWLTRRAKQEHGVKLGADALEVLFELLPMSLGVLDQEVARLSLLVGEEKAIHAKLVQEQVGGWRVQTAWEMIDLALDGRAADALTQIDRLLLAGEQPIGLLAQFGSTLRRFAAAMLIIERDESAGRKPNLGKALAEAGVARFKADDAQRQLRAVGRVRARQLDQWLLDADLAMKGHNSSPPRARLELERLIFRLSKEAASPA